MSHDAKCQCLPNNGPLTVFTRAHGHVFRASEEGEEAWVGPPDWRATVEFLAQNLDVARPPISIYLFIYGCGGGGGYELLTHFMEIGRSQKNGVPIPMVCYTFLKCTFEGLSNTISVGVHLTDTSKCRAV